MQLELRVPPFMKQIITVLLGTDVEIALTVNKRYNRTEISNMRAFSALFTTDSKIFSVATFCCNKFNSFFLVYWDEKQSIHFKVHHTPNMHLIHIKSSISCENFIPTINSRVISSQYMKNEIYDVIAIELNKLNFRKLSGI